jgi:hypothetical protein
MAWLLEFRESQWIPSSVQLMTEAIAMLTRRPDPLWTVRLEVEQRLDREGYRTVSALSMELCSCRLLTLSTFIR